MVEEVSRLSVRLDASIARFERNMERARRTMDRSARTISRQADSLDSRLEKVGDRLGISIPGRAIAVAAAIAAVGKVLNDIVRSGDNLKQLEGRFTALTGSAERAGKLIEAAFDIGAETGGSFEGITEGLTRFTIAGEAIGATDEEVARLTETLLKLGAIGGGSAQEVRSGVIQLGQALAKGRLDGDELRSVMENLPLVARAIADGLGVGVGQLKEMGKAGELVAGKVFDALLSKTDEVDRQFAKLPQTVERAAGRMATAWVRFIAKMDQSLGLAQKLSFVIDQLSDGLDVLAGTPAPGILVPEAAERAQEVEGALGRLEAEIDRLRAAGELESPIGRQAIEDARALRDELEAITDLFRDEGLRAAAAAVIPGTSGGPPRRATVGGAGGLGQVSALPEKFLPPERAKFIDDPFSTGDGGGRRAVDREAAGIIDTLRERIELLGQEQHLAGLSGVAQAELTAEFERQRIVREFNNAAARENAEVTPEMVAQAEALAQRVKDEAVALAVLNDVLETNEQAQQDAARAAEENRRQIERIGDAISNAIIQAESFAEALRNVAVALANIAVQDFEARGKNSFLGKLFSAGASAVAGGAASGGGSGPAFETFGRNAKGNVISAGSMVPFAQGGVVSRPTVFPMANGIGLMGEAGPEAILPLKRGPGGRLGVAGGGAGVTVQIINNTAAKVREERATGPRGEEVRRFLIEEVGKEMARGGFDGQQRARFALAPSRIKR
jgi:tape measure domain-containing protein